MVRGGGGAAGSDARGAISHASLADDGNFYGAECLSYDGNGGEFNVGSGYCRLDDGGADTLWTYHSQSQTIESALGGCWTDRGDQGGEPGDPERAGHASW